eukprot:5773239-Amphidinium_carterae.1
MFEDEGIDMTSVPALVSCSRLLIPPQIYGSIDASTTFHGLQTCYCIHEVCIEGPTTTPILAGPIYFKLFCAPRGGANYWESIPYWSQSQQQPSVLVGHCCAVWPSSLTLVAGHCCAMWPSQ